VSKDKVLEKVWKQKFSRWRGGKLSKEYRWEVLFFHQLRNRSDGITFFEFIVNLDMYDPFEYAKFKNNPSFNIHLVLCNWTVFQIEIYKCGEHFHED